MPVHTAPLLPKVSLKDRVIPTEVLHYIPLEMMKRFQVAVFEVTEDSMHLAIVYPDQLKQGFWVALKDMGEKVGKKIELFKTDAASLQALIKQYGSAPVAKSFSKPAVAPAWPPPKQSVASPKLVPVVPSASMPPKEVPKAPLFEVGRTVAYNYLRRVPLEFAQKHRLVSVDFLKPDNYWFVTDGTKQADLEHILPFIEKENNIKINLLTIKPKELNDLLSYYADLITAEDERVLEQHIKNKEAAFKDKAQPLPPMPAVEVEKPVVVVQPTQPDVPVASQEVTVPDIQAEVISGEAEKGGLAGLIQRVSHSFSSGEDKKEQEDAIEKQFEARPSSVRVADNKPKGTAPDTGVSSRSAAVPAQAVAVPLQSAEQVAADAAAQAKADEGDGDIGKLLDTQVLTIDQLKEHIKKGFIPRIVAAVVSYAISEKASDVHIEAFEDEVRVRYRIDGQLLDIVKLPPDVHAAMVSRIKILSRLRLDETRIPQDGRFDVNFDHAQVDLRVSIMPTVHGEKVVMRILDKSKGIASLEKLGIEGMAYQELTKSIQKPFGICLATGPTGSGKSTTLYAILNRIATPNVNVVTLEDPVEYEMKGINQAQIRPKIGFTFAEGLRSILRQDPNIIMVGEIRDGETANMATQAALTGHLVLSTLHTNDAAGAIPRLSNMGIEPFLTASSLNIAIGQRLVRKICPNCKKAISLPPGFKMQIEKDIAVIEALNPIDAGRIKKPYTFYQGMGCTQCGGKGYQGRVGIYEVLVMTDAIEDLTLAHASNEQIQAQAQKDGMLTMYQDGLIKVINGITTLDEVLRETSTK